MAKRWTEKEVRTLMMGLGAFGIDWFRQRTGTSYDYPNAPQRSIKAISCRIARAAGGYGFVKGAYTLASLVKRSGYDKRQIRRAQSALNQKWKRTSLRGSFLITDDQAEELLAWLQHDYWSRKRRLYCCVQCSSTGRRPKVWGLCRPCYKRVYDAINRLRVELPAGDLGLLDEFIQKVRGGKGFRWAHLRELMKRCRSRSRASS